MILHAVYFPVPDNADQNALAAIMHDLGKLVGEIDGFTAFHHGPNIDVEGKSPEADYGFHGTYTDRTALDRYANDPRHQALGARLVALCGGPEGPGIAQSEGDHSHSERRTSAG